MGAPTNIPAEWLTADHEVISPNAPAGGGGSGKFRTPGSLGDGDPVNPALPDPGAPAGRYLIPPDPDKLDANDPAAVPVQPPPKTQPTTLVLRKQQDEANDIDVVVEVIPDMVGATTADEADTHIILDDMTPNYPAFQVDAKGFVVSLENENKNKTKFVFKGRIVVQAQYKQGINKSDPSAYGRGTTDDDKKKGNITIGFHESCHINDHLTWFGSHDLPIFAGKVGMKEAAFDKAIKDFDAALKKYLADDDKNTEAMTDEVGSPKRSQWLKANKP